MTAEAGKKPLQERLLDFMLMRDNEPIPEIKNSFIKFVRSERKYKLAASFSFFAFVFAIGIPMWYYTTSTYRASFPTYSQNRSISIPVRVNIAVTDEEIKSEVMGFLQELKMNLTQKETVAPLTFDFHVAFLEVISLGELNSVQNLEHEEQNDAYDVFVALVANKHWDHYSATHIRLGVGKWNFIQWPKIGEDNSKTKSRITDLIWEVLIDAPHLTSIVRRDLRQKMLPWQIAALPLSHQKRLVWDSAPLAREYHIQVIHLHENEEPSDNELKMQHKTSEALRRFGNLVRDITKVEVSVEHFWDFEVTHSYLVKDVQERWTLTHSAMEELIKGVDMQMQTSLDDGAVLRFVILETKEPVIILDQTDEDSTGLAVAAWGAILTRNEHTESRAIAAMRIQLGMDAELLPGWWRPAVPVCTWEITRARMRASFDNAMRAISAIRALDELKNKISNIVINDDVMLRATKAVRLLEESLQKGKILDYDKLLEARRIADSANSDHSLLALLYFPLDQRTAVIIPLAVPLVLPTIRLLWEIIVTFYYGFL